jgi:hypothetical protein
LEPRAHPDETQLALLRRLLLGRLLLGLLLCHNVITSFHRATVKMRKITVNAFLHSARKFSRAAVMTIFNIQRSTFNDRNVIRACSRRAVA